MKLRFLLAGLVCALFVWAVSAQQAPVVTAHGKVQKVDKDVLKWCTASAGDTERPKEFGSRAGSNVALYTFKRQKP